MPAALDQASAQDLYDAVRTRAWTLYEQMPTLVCTGRTGALEGAWRPRGDGYTVVAEHPLNADARRVEHSRLARLVLAYADHPDADADLLTRNARFPRSVELYLG